MIPTPLTIYLDAFHEHPLIDTQQTFGNAYEQVLANALASKADRAAWSRSVAATAAAYREQVLLDFKCFGAFVKTNFTDASDEHGRAGSASKRMWLSEANRRPTRRGSSEQQSA